MSMNLTRFAASRVWLDGKGNVRTFHLIIDVSQPVKLRLKFELGCDAVPHLFEGGVNYWRTARNSPKECISFIRRRVIFLRLGTRFSSKHPANAVPEFRRG